jgi:hypothetical protein
MSEVTKKLNIDHVDINAAEGGVQRRWYFPALSNACAEAAVKNPALSEARAEAAVSIPALSEARAEACTEAPEAKRPRSYASSYPEG